MIEVAMFLNTNMDEPLTVVETNHVPREKEFLRIDTDSKVLYEVIEVEYIFIENTTLYRVHIVLRKL